MGWKNIITIMALINFSAKAQGLEPGLNSSALGPNTPEIVSVSLEKAYMPIGFDDNDNVQVVTAGVFPNTCYKVGPATFEVDEYKNTITIHQTAYHYGGMCLQMLVPFSEVTNLGILPKGRYEIRDKESEKKLGAIPISRATGPSPDDYLYAPINDAYTTQEGPKKNLLRLYGTFSNPCMKLKEVRVNYYEDTIVVQPISEVNLLMLMCPQVIVPFTYAQPLKEGLSGSQLLHVRSMNGQSINKIIDFQ